MREQNIAQVTNIEYDVDTSLILKQPDLRALSEFCYAGNKDSICITYSDTNECRRRQMSLRHWLSENGYGLKYAMHKNKEKLFIVKEHFKCQQTTQ